jgi:hypothetical protein
LVAQINRKMKLTRGVYVALIVSGVLFRASIFTHLPRDLSVCATDYSAFYAGGRLVGSSSLYQPKVTLTLLDQAMGCHAPWAVFIKPPFYAALMWPLSQLTFERALFIWRVLGILALAAFVYLWPGNKYAAVASCAWFLPVSANFTVGQDVAFLLFFLMAGYRLIERDSPYIAGLILGLCAIKFHLFLLLPVLIIQKRLWRVAAGLVTTGAALVALSFVAAGPHWLTEYFEALRNQESYYSSGGFDYPNLRCLFHGYSPAFLCAAAAVILLTCLLIRFGSLATGFTGVLMGGLLLAPHSTLADYALLVPVLLVAVGSGLGVCRYLAMFLMTPFVVALPGGSDVWTLLLLVLLSMFAYQITVLGEDHAAYSPA